MEFLKHVFLLVLALGVIDGSPDGDEMFGDVTPEPVDAGEVFNAFSPGLVEGSDVPDDDGSWDTMVKSQNWNTVIDDLLTQLSIQIKEQGKDVMDIRNIEEGFSKNLGLVKAVGKFEATGGTIKNISSIHRRGDVLVSSKRGQSLTLSTHLGFNNLQVRYPHYKAKFLGVGPTGEINARVVDNDVQMTLRIDMEENSCSIVLEEAKVKLGKMKVHVTGLRPFNWLLSRIFTWLTKECQTNIVKTIEQTLDFQLRYVFQNTVLDC